MEPGDVSDAEEIPAPLDEDAAQHDSADYQTLANGFLTPRHRRLCQLAALGTANGKIAEELGYAGSRISILLKNPVIAAEVRRLQDRVFEETIQQRMKTFAEPALNNIHMILTDRTNRVKISEKMALSQWVVEKLDGKAVQKHDVGENMLSVLLDRLDSQRSAAPVPHRTVAEVIEVRAIEAKKEEPTGPKSEEDLLEEWIADFDASGS